MSNSPNQPPGFNPYVSPAFAPEKPSADSFAKPARDYTYQSAAKLVIALTILLATNLCLALVLGVLEFLQATVYWEGLMNAEFAEDGSVMFLVGYTLVAFSLLFIYLVTGIVYCVWIHRANRNARALGAYDMEITPGWAVGWFFVPFANLYMPCKAVSEIFRASDPACDSTNWKLAPTSWIIGAWWGLWILSNIVGQVEARMAMSADGNLVLASCWLGVADAVLSVPLVLLAISVVRTIQSRQVEKHSKVSLLPTTPMTATPTTGWSDFR